jgi:hypothetical protein
VAATVCGGGGGSLIALEWTDKTNCPCSPPPLTHHVMSRDLNSNLKRLKLHIICLKFRLHLNFILFYFFDYSNPKKESKLQQGIITRKFKGKKYKHNTKGRQGGPK